MMSPNLSGFQAFIGDIVAILNRRHHITGLDRETGTFDLREDDRTVRVTLPPGLLDEYVGRLDEKAIPDLRHAEPETQDRLRVRHIVVWIEELFEADLTQSLREIRLTRTPDGRLSLVDRSSTYVVRHGGRCR